MKPQFIEPGPRGNQNKKAREYWCAEKLLNAMKISGKINADLQDADTSDVEIIHSDKTYGVQIVEIAPQDPNVKEAFAFQLSGDPYSNLKLHTSSLIKRTLEQKASKSYTDAESINLLIYFNGPNEILLDGNMDFDSDELHILGENCPFGSVVILTNDETHPYFFIKGQVLVPQPKKNIKPPRLPSPCSASSS